MKIKDRVIGSLKAFKRNAKMVPEFGRALYGSASRSWSNSDDPLLALGAVVASAARPYRPETSRVPVSIVTPADGHYMTTFFDVDPLSPSGRYLAVTKVPFIWRIPIRGDLAQVVVIDLQEGQAQALYTTRGWGAQLGANVQWGADDDTLFCNDIVRGKPTGVRLNRKTGEATPLEGPIYGLTPDKKYSFSGSIDLINAGIPGYGVPEGLFAKRRQSVMESTEEGIWKTDLETGKRELFLSVAEIVSQLPQQEDVKGGKYYIFNVKINRQGTRGFVVLFSRKIPGRPGWPPQLVTFDTDGSNIRLAVPDKVWRVGGHHPSWLPCGERIIMNLRAPKEKMRFASFNYAGEEMEVLAQGHVGGGHPSLNPRQTHLLTDAYTSESFVDPNGDVPIRFVDLATNEDEPLTRVHTRKLDGPRRIDPHPVWIRNGDGVVFNAVVDGKRQVLLADVRDL